ncbi:MAG: hypothetical protein ACOH14_14240 [Rhodoglobus sp.]
MTDLSAPDLSRAEFAEACRFGIHDLDVEADRYLRRDGVVS